MTRRAWEKKPNAPKRLTGRALQDARRRLFARKPLCEACERQGRVTLATERDHRIPLARGGTDDPENEAALCSACHAVKSALERGAKPKVQIGPDGYPVTKP